jgi:hypothetical protein
MEIPFVSSVLLKVKVKVKIKVTSRISVYRQSVRPGELK